MEPLIPQAIAGLGWQELMIILVIAIVLFGGSRLAGIGRSSGRAIREFKEETRGLKEDERRAAEQKEAEKRSATNQLEGGRPGADGAADPAPEQNADGRD